MHHDHGNPADGLDIAALLAEPQPGTQIYYCGPPGFMKACAEASAHWPKGTVHSEHFKAPEQERPTSQAGDSGSEDFEVEVASTGQRVHVDADQSIVDALTSIGVDVETSCVSGLCGSCKVRYLAGEPDHRDFILDDEEKEEFLTVCVSRCRSDLLVLDL